MIVSCYGGARGSGEGRITGDGKINWPSIMKKIALTGYRGATALEPMNWGYGDLPIREFLSRAYQQAKWLDGLGTVEIPTGIL